MEEFGYILLGAFIGCIATIVVEALLVYVILIKDRKERCCEVLAEFLEKEGYFSVGFDPNEIDIDKLGKA